VRRCAKGNKTMSSGWQGKKSKSEEPLESNGGSPKDSNPRKERPGQEYEVLALDRASENGHKKGTGRKTQGALLVRNPQSYSDVEIQQGPTVSGFYLT